MADSSHIEWTDATWQPITGCTIISPGCINCYAMTLAAGRLRNHHSRKGLTKPSKAGPVWTGEVRFNEHWLDQPLRWTKPRRVFVCAHGDLFHESVPDEWIDKVVAVMVLARQHTFQVLTKRAARALDYLSNLRIGRLEKATRSVGGPFPPVAWEWPIPNVWLGVSAERQQEADERIPLLLQTPAAVRFVSAEPLLGPIDLTAIEAPEKVEGERWTFNALTTGDYYEQWSETCLGEPRRSGGDGPHREHRLDWIIVGGESGKNARPMHPGWARSLRDQCETADVKFFFKQWGEHIVAPTDRYRDHEHTFLTKDWDFVRVGKAAAGRLLDGKEHSEFPHH